MTDRCEVPRCRAEADLVYLDHGICNTHWMGMAADDAPPDKLRMVLGIGTIAPSAMEDDMAKKKHSTKTTGRKAKTRTAKKNGKKAAPRKPAPKSATKPVKTKGSKPNRVFAIRVTDAELAAIHKAAGPRNATRFIRAVAAAFARGDESAFRAALKAAREARS